MSPFTAPSKNLTVYSALDKLNLWSGYAKAAQKLGLMTIQDLLFFFPRQYENREQIHLIRSLNHQDVVIIFAQILDLQEKIINKKSVLTVSIKDESGIIDAILFNQHHLTKVFKKGDALIIKGKVEQTLLSKKIYVQEFEILQESADKPFSLGCWVPIYSLTSGVYQSQLRKLSRALFRQFSTISIQETLPEEIINKAQLVSLKKALFDLHYPKNQEVYQAARKRWVFEEFFYFHLKIAYRKYHLQHPRTAPSFCIEHNLISQYFSKLPYPLTASQTKVIQEVKKDLVKSTPMNRLVQGDVGSGKTDVIIASLLMAVQSCKVGVLMVPTEILAIQHYLKMKKRLTEFNIPLFLLKGKLKTKEKNQIKEEIKKKIGSIVIGTHALLEETVSIPELGLIVVDEQHRFGVMQRMTLKNKAQSPHCLFTTATPIPRSFLLTCFGDLDKSIIDELPPGRVPAKTYYVTEKNIDAILIHCEKQLAQGRQLYVVYPLIEESEKLDLRSAQEGFSFFQKRYPNYHCALLHGRIPTEEKETIMSLFSSGQIQVLVATTVIEVGVDVPNATMMIIFHAERFGLSQLHQLRGRIGRGGQLSYCYLVGDAKTASAKQRLNAMLATTDGFKLAEFDLAIRGPGEILGTRQSGLPEFKLADLSRDEDIARMSQYFAKSLLKEPQQLTQYPFLKQRLDQDNILGLQPLN